MISQVTLDIGIRKIEQLFRPSFNILLEVLE